MEFSKFKKAIQDHFAKLSETADHCQNKSGPERTLSP